MVKQRSSTEDAGSESVRNGARPKTTAITTHPVIAITGPAAGSPCRARITRSVRADAQHRPGRAVPWAGSPAGRDARHDHGRERRRG